MIDSYLQKDKNRQKTDAEKIRDFQRKIYQKAKQEKTYRFYILYDKIYKLSFLLEAYKRVKANGGAPGVDGVNFDDIENEGWLDYLLNIQEELKNKTYRPREVKRVMIPKANGKKRPLGIPTIKDRIVQMACKIVIEPIFEADFEDTSYGFRPKRNAADAIIKIKQNLKEGKVNVFDADLSAYFDTIPHNKLLILIGKRVSDKNVIHLIKMWLKAPISENGKISGGKRNKVGTPQGGVISPLLANIYLNLLDKMINNPDNIFGKSGVKIVRYADDYILMGKTITKQMMNIMENLLNRMELKINNEKSKILNATENAFDFLGFTFRYDKDLRGRQIKYWNVIPSEKSLNKYRENIRENLKKKGHYAPENVATLLNSITRGWINYFDIHRISYPAMAKRKIRWFLMDKIYRYYNRKSQRKCRLYGGKAYEKLVRQYGLIDPWYYNRMTLVKA